MAEKIKKGDFIEVDYIGRIKASNNIFDLTLEDVAKKENIYQEGKKYKPIKIKVGSNHLIKGLDEAIEKKSVGDEFEIDIPVEKAFGKKDPKLIKLTSLKIFKEKKINPVPGLQLDMGGAIATIRSVSSGRVILDFNHPLAGRELKYWVKINKKITDTKEKIYALFELLFRLPKKEIKINIKGDIAEIQFTKNPPKEIEKDIKELIKEEIKEIKTVIIKKKETDKAKKEDSKENKEKPRSEK